MIYDKAEKIYAQKGKGGTCLGHIGKCFKNEEERMITTLAAMGLNDLKCFINVFECIHQFNTSAKDF